MTATTMFYRYLLNPTMRLLLRSPFHGVTSHNITILHFTGRKSGRKMSTPLSYTREGDTVRLLTNYTTHWWKNFRGSEAEVELELRRSRHSGTARLLEGDSEDLRAGVRTFIAALPRDAAVYDLELDDNKQLVETSLLEHVSDLVLVEITLNS
jgi:hypothetical protein